MRAIFFDLDDTLYDRKLPFREAFFEFDQEKAEQIDIVKAHKTFVKRGNEVFDASEQGRITMEEMYIYRFQKAMQDMGLFFTDQDSLRFQEIYQRRMHAIHLSEEIRQMLETLAERGQCMGIITNGPSIHQREKIRALKIDQWIKEEYWLISGDYNAPKPDPFMYRKAQELVGAQKEELLYVGDSYDRDMMGAFALEWKTLWFNKKNRQLSPDDKIPDWIACSEAEMKEIILHQSPSRKCPLECRW